MKRLARAVAAGLGFVLVVFGVVFWCAVTFSLDRSQPEFQSNVFASGMFFVITIAGLFLIRFAWPGWLGRLPGRVFRREALYNPLVHAPAFYVAGVLLALPSGTAALFVVLLVLCAYAVASPAIIALRPRWGVNALLSTVLGIVLVVVLTATAEAVTHGHFGDDAMVVLFPITIFPVSLALSLAFRLVAAQGEKKKPPSQEL